MIKSVSNNLSNKSKNQKEDALVNKLKNSMKEQENGVKKSSIVYKLSLISKIF